MTDPDRYTGKPMLRLLDAYVLDALGALDETTEDQMRAMAPKFASALNVPDGDWRTVVETAMEMPPTASDELRQLWEHHVHEVIEARGTPDVLSFTHRLVDARFA